MNLLEETRSLVQELADSHADRYQNLQDLKKSIDETLKTFSSERSDGKESMKSKLVQNKKKIEEEVMEIKKSTADMLNSFKKELDLLFEASRLASKKNSPDIREELKEENKKRIEASREKILSLKKQYNENTRLNINKRKIEIENLHKEVKDILSDIRESLKNQFDELRQKRLADISNMKQSVDMLRNNLNKERQVIIDLLEETRAVWSEYLVNEESCEDDEVEAEPSVESIDDASPEVGEMNPDCSVLERATEEEDFAVTGEDLKTRFLSVIKAHPEGISLTDVADKLGMATVALGRVSRNLLDEGGIRREGKLYFPLSEGEVEIGEK